MCARVDPINGSSTLDHRLGNHKLTFAPTVNSFFLPISLPLLPPGLCTFSRGLNKYQQRRMEPLRRKLALGGAKGREDAESRKSRAKSEGERQVGFALSSELRGC